MNTDVEGERALGEITRTAAGRAASLTIVWQEFRIQLLSSSLFSFHLLSSLFLSFPFLFSCTFFLTIVCPSPLLHPYPHPPSLPFAKTTTYTWSGGMQSVSEGQVWCDSKWEERGSCLSWPWSTSRPQHNVTMKERAEGGFEWSSAVSLDSIISV